MDRIRWTDRGTPNNSMQLTALRAAADAGRQARRVMANRYCIEDELQAEIHSEHATLQEAVAELERLARIPWDADPNIAPCQSWRTCGRRYEIIE